MTIADKMRKPRIVLIFNAAFKLIAIARSVRAAAELTRGNPQAISFAATGKIISSGGFYFRFIPDHLEVGAEDLNNLDLKEYDALCSENRKYRKSHYLRGKRVLNFKNHGFLWK